MKKRVIFQLGSNNWQRPGEFAPGSGILHEAHHKMYNKMEDTVCYSVYPSRFNDTDDPTVHIFQIDHDVPICESVSPVSSYRFHSMSDEEFQQYLNRLEAFVERKIIEIEEREQADVDAAIAHHTFINALVLGNVNKRRRLNGRSPMKLCCFVHGTALKMYAHELNQDNEEYPLRFLPLMQKMGVFSRFSPYDVCATISNEQSKRFSCTFPNFPKDRVLMSPNGYDTSIFKPDSRLYFNRGTFLQGVDLPPSPSRNAPDRIDPYCPGYVVHCGKFADWKRQDALLAAARTYEYEQGLGTLIIGTGPDEDIERLHRLAYDELGLQKTYFLGPKSQTEIAKINAVADVGVYPSRNEPFGLVLIEAMACGTPVIGCASGGPADFVDDTVGGLIPECEGPELSTRIAEAVKSSIQMEWKRKRGPEAAKMVSENYSTRKQCQEIIDSLFIEPELQATLAVGNARALRASHA